ncbi:hypothetical protein [Methylobacterium sp. E-016]|jgi:hypothetical protein|nr:hypothetical protein [Methylobacterium sp. E-016]
MSLPFEEPIDSMPDSPATPRRSRRRDLLVAIVLTVWIVAVARTERTAQLTPPVVSYAAASR